MKTFKHAHHTVYELQKFNIEGSAFHPSIVFISRKCPNAPLKARIKNRSRDWAFHIYRNPKMPLRWLIRTPIFMTERNTTGLTIGAPNHYFWFIELSLLRNNRKSMVKHASL